MGGYDFPGSTSEVDLFTLTGWMPETTYTKEREFQREGEKEKAWNRMKDGHWLGKCLMTMSTKELTETDEREMGLVSKHAYAVLDVREIPIHNLRYSVGLGCNEWFLFLVCIPRLSRSKLFD